MSLATPGKIRELQKKLYGKAKQEPSYRFYLLYDKLYREDILAHAYALAKAHQGAPGVDGEDFRQIEEGVGWEAWLVLSCKSKRYNLPSGHAFRRATREPNRSPLGAEGRTPSPTSFVCGMAEAHALTYYCVYLCN